MLALAVGARVEYIDKNYTLVQEGKPNENFWPSTFYGLWDNGLVKKDSDGYVISDNGREVQVPNIRRKPKRNGAFVAQQKRHRELIAQNNILSDKLREARKSLRELILAHVNMRDKTIALLKEEGIENPDWLVPPSAQRKK